MTTILTESGRTKTLPTHVIEVVCGLDEEGRIVVDNFDALHGDGPFLGNLHALVIEGTPFELRELAQEMLAVIDKIEASIQ